MNILAISHNLSDPTPHLDDELRRITELRDAGVLDELWLKADRSGAVMVLEAHDADDAQRQLATLPLVARGITTVHITELVSIDGDS